MELSVVVPVYLEAKTIRKRIFAIASVLENANLDYEIIVVVDGTHQSGGHQSVPPSVHPFGRDNIKIINLDKNYGKGYAVCTGMKKAKGEVVAFIDGGNEIDAEFLVFFWHFMKATNADIVVGSKLHPASIVSYPVVRRVLSWGYQMLTRVLFGLWVRDTQVGIKMFKGEVVKKVVPKLMVKSYAYDVELLALAMHFGFKKIYEAPIKVKWKGGVGLSSKKIWIVIARMMWDTWAVFYRLRILKYYD